LTGGLYEPHAKGKQTESQHNFTQADPGLFVITKAKSQQYRDAVDNNDKISKTTILRNIHNSKEEKAPATNYADGGNVWDNLYQNEPTSANYVPSLGAQPITNTMSTPTLKGSITPVANPYNYQEPQSGSNKALNAITNYGAAAFNIGKGLFGKVEKQPYVTPIQNPYEQQVLANMPKQVSYDALQGDLNRGLNTEFGNIAQRSGSASVARANRQQTYSNYLNSLGKLKLGVNEANNQIAQQKAGIYSNLGQQKVAAQQQAQATNRGIYESNLANKAAKENLLGTGLSQLQQVAQNTKLNEGKAKSDQYILDLIKQVNPYFKG